MELDDQIRAYVYRYVRGALTLGEFQAWFTDATWDINPDTDPVANGMASSILLLLAELSNGDLDEGELKAELEPLVELQPAPTQTTFVGSTSVTNEPSSVVGTAHVAVFG